MRTTNDKKDYSIRVRVSAEMYEHMSRYAYNGMSNYIRDLIQKDIVQKRNGLNISGNVRG